jgi:CheY-like chemotaxis protein
MVVSSAKKILIIEDSPEKAKAISKCLSEIKPRFELVHTETIIVAGQLLEHDKWSGIVLDLAFHRNQQTGSVLNRPYLAGVEILQQMNELRLVCPVIIATQHSSFISTKYGDFHSLEDLCKVLRKVFPENFRELIEVDFGENEWRNQLVLSARKHFQ